MYNPPSKSHWVSSHSFQQEYADEYDAGFKAAADGKSLDDNPNELSGHERDTTYSDELHYWWYVGFSNFSEK